MGVGKITRADRQRGHPRDGAGRRADDDLGGSTAHVGHAERDRRRHLDRQEFAAALELLRSQPAAVLAKRFDLDVDRVRLLPAGLLILEGIQAAFAVPLELVGGGLREGVVLELGDSRS